MLEKQSKIEILKSFEFEMTTPTLLIGPITMSEMYSARYDKHVYILGDYHDKKTVCQAKGEKFPITDFFHYLIENTPGIIDFFLELEYLSKTVEPFKKGTILNALFGDSYIDDVRKEFANCLTIDKKNCEYPNVRMHYADIRYSSRYTPFLMLNWMDFVNERNEKMIDYLFKKRADELKIFPITFQKLIEGNPLITKELMAIHDEKVTDHILEWYRQQFDYYVVTQDDFLELKEFKDPDEYHSAFISLENKLLTMTSIIMDIYLLARMFRNFEDAPSPKKIVIFAGENHALDYRAFFQELGFKELNYAESEKEGVDYQCLELDKFIPFFE